MFRHNFVRVSPSLLSLCSVHLGTAYEDKGCALQGGLPPDCITPATSHMWVVDKEDSMYDRATIDALKTSLRGELLQLDDAGYEVARKVYNGMIDRRPHFIARCSNVADVIAAVKFACKHQLLVAVRGGGHNGAGLGTCDDGLVIDLSRLQGIRVDPIARTVQVEGGCTWGDVDHATHAFGLATPSGIMSTTGVGGLTLGGGLGYLTRKYGLVIDNLLAVDVVLADGRLVTANESRNVDLFWA